MKKIFLIILLFISESLFACSIFSIKNSDNHTLVGRNFDWTKGDARVNFIPSDKNNNGVILFSFDDVEMSYDGMNDKGLFVAISAVPQSETTVNILKPIRKSLEFVKIILQKASNIDEAIQQFDKYSIIFGQFLGNPLIHFKIVDKFGKSVIVEFVNNKMVVTNKAKIMTNHYLSDLSITPDSKTSFKRFKTLQNRNYKTIEDVFKGLSRVKQDDTLWSNVYDLTNQIVYVKYEGRDIVKFNLKDEMYKHNKAFYYDMETINNVKKLSFIESKSTIAIRPHFGFGSDNIRHNGVRVLLKSSDNQSYGLEFTNFKTDNDEFNAIGIVLEQRLWEWFNMSIGTVGYFDYGVDNQNAVGIVSNLGWEPNNHIPFNPFVTLRNDIIFAKDETDSLYSISFGIKMEF